MPTPSEDPILTMQEAAERLGIPVRTLQRHVRETTIWATKMEYGSDWGIKESELQRFLNVRWSPKTEPEGRS